MKALLKVADNIERHDRMIKTHTTRRGPKPPQDEAHVERKLPSIGRKKSQQGPSYSGSEKWDQPKEHREGVRPRDWHDPAE